MAYRRYGAGATVYDGKIFIFGGLSIDCKPLSSVECYDPLSNTWISCCDMRGARGWPGVSCKKIVHCYMSLSLCIVGCCIRWFDIHYWWL